MNHCDDGVMEEQTIGKRDGVEGVVSADVKASPNIVLNIEQKK